MNTHPLNESASRATAYSRCQTPGTGAALPTPWLSPASPTAACARSRSNLPAAPGPSPLSSTARIARRTSLVKLALMGQRPGIDPASFLRAPKGREESIIGPQSLAKHLIHLVFSTSLLAFDESHL